MRSRLKKLEYPFYLLIVAFLAYFWFLHYAPIYDFADEFFPGRFFMSESIRNGIFPLWIPYQSMGLPIHADPQAGTFYLPLWILSLFTSYSPYTWGVEYIFHAFMGGVGFYMLAKHFSTSKQIRFIAGCIFMLSGFYVGNVQHISWIIAATWIPWILSSTITYLQSPTFKNGLWIALFFSFLFTGGYPGFWILTFYIIIGLFIYFLIINRKNNDKQYYKKLLLYSISTLVVVLILILPSLISFLEIKNYITRGAPLSYDLQISCSYSPRSFLSLFFPFIANTESEFIQNDISMSSIYVGIITLPFLIMGIFTKYTKWNRFFIGLGIVALLLSFGKYLPFHRWAFEYIPFINMMRLPSIFRLFIIIPIILLIINGLEAFIVNKNRKWLKIVTITIIFGLLIVVILIDYFSKTSILGELKTLTWQNSIYKSIGFKFIINGLIQILFLTIFYIIIHRKRTNNSIIYILIIIDLLFNSTICIHKTGYVAELTNKELAHFLSKKPQNYLIPNEITTSNQIYWETPYPSLWRNLGIFEKKIEWFSYKGVILKNFELMTTPNQQVGKELYFPKVAFFPEEVIYSKNALPITPEIAYTNDKNLVKKYIDSTSVIKISGFKPGLLEVKTQTLIKRPLIIAQSYYPGWKAKLKNGTLLKIKPLNSSMLSVLVPAGSQIITFYYSRSDIVIAFIIQMFGYLIFIIFIMLKTFKRK